MLGTKAFNEAPLLTKEAESGHAFLKLAADVLRLVEAWCARNVVPLSSEMGKAAWLLSAPTVFATR